MESISRHLLPSRIILLFLINLKGAKSLKVYTCVLNPPASHSRCQVAMLHWVFQRRCTFNIKIRTTRDCLPQVLEAVVDVDVPCCFRVSRSGGCDASNLPVVETNDVLWLSQSAILQDFWNACPEFIYNIPGNAARVKR